MRAPSGTSTAIDGDEQRQRRGDLDARSPRPSATRSGMMIGEKSGKSDADDRERPVRVVDRREGEQVADHEQHREHGRGRLQVLLARHHHARASRTARTRAGSRTGTRRARPRACRASPASSSIAPLADAAARPTTAVSGELEQPEGADAEDLAGEDRARLDRRRAAPRSRARTSPPPRRRRRRSRT